jgi:hypothetical protein
MIATLLIALLIIWLVGMIFNIGGGLIHLLLLIGLIVLIVDLLRTHAHRDHY